MAPRAYCASTVGISACWAAGIAHTVIPQVSAQTSLADDRQIGRMVSKTIIVLIVLALLTASGASGTYLRRQGRGCVLLIILARTRVNAVSIV